MTTASIAFGKMRTYLERRDGRVARALLRTDAWEPRRRTGRPARRPRTRKGETLGLRVLTLRPRSGVNLVEGSGRCGISSRPRRSRRRSRARRRRRVNALFIHCPLLLSSNLLGPPL